eukprot:5187174-Pleurochrysis_carterae.AAC.1
MARHHPLDSLDANLPIDVRLKAEWVLLHRAEKYLIAFKAGPHTFPFFPSHIMACTPPKPHVALIDALVHALDWLDLLFTEQLILHRRSRHW